MAKTRAQQNRAIRQEALREQLSTQKHFEKAIDIAREIRELAPTIETSHLNALKASADIHLKIGNKYLPDLKSAELTGEGGGAVVVNANDLTDEQLANIASRSS